MVYTLVFFLGEAVTCQNATVHALNAAFTLFERLIVATPVRLLHFHHVIVYGILYATFTGIYYAAGGTNGPDGELTYIYPILDYEKSPGMAVLWLFILVFPASMLIHSVMFIVYLFTNCVLSKCCGCRRENEDAEENEEEEMKGHDNVAFDQDKGKSATEIV